MLVRKIKCSGQWSAALLLIICLFIGSSLPVDAASPGSSVNVSGDKWFDKCGVPSTSAMQTWWSSSPYWNVGIYIGGINASSTCQGATSTWVSTVNDQGWSFIPTYVGRQAPCTTNSSYATISTDSGTAASQAYSAAKDAESAANNLGFSQGTVIYLDMEGYNTGNSSCRSIVNIYVSNWVATLKADGYRAGVYGSSCGSAINDWAGIAHPPDDVWIAEWNDNTNVYGVSCVNSGYWIYSQRHHQYHNDGSTAESYGGVSFIVDRDCTEGHVAGRGNNDGTANSCP